MQQPQHQQQPPHVPPGSYYPAPHESFYAAAAAMAQQQPPPPFAHPHYHQPNHAAVYNMHHAHHMAAQQYAAQQQPAAYDQQPVSDLQAAPEQQQSQQQLMAAPASDPAASASAAAQSWAQYLGAQSVVQQHYYPAMPEWSAGQQRYFHFVSSTIQSGQTSALYSPSYPSSELHSQAGYGRRSRRSSTSSSASRSSAHARHQPYAHAREAHAERVERQRSGNAKEEPLEQQQQHSSPKQEGQVQPHPLPQQQPQERVQIEANSAEVVKEEEAKSGEVKGEGVKPVRARPLVVKTKAELALSSLPSLPSSRSSRSSPSPSASPSPPASAAAAVASSSPRPASYIVFKSLDYEDVNISQAQGIWATQPQNEQRVNQLFNSSGTLYAFFSVNGSRAFQGYARVACAIGAELRDSEWLKADGKGTWGSLFRVDWLCTTRLPFDRVSHLTNPFNENRPLKICRDGTEIEPSVGEKLRQLFHADAAAASLPRSIKPEGGVKQEFSRPSRPPRRRAQHANSAGIAPFPVSSASAAASSSSSSFAVDGQPRAVPFPRSSPRADLHAAELAARAAAPLTQSGDPIDTPMHSQLDMQYQ